MFFFFFNDTATTEIYTLSLHDALPISTTRRLSMRASSCCSATTSICCASSRRENRRARASTRRGCSARSEEHTSELQSPCNLVCRLLLEKKKNRGTTRNRLGEQVLPDL